MRDLIAQVEQFFILAVEGLAEIEHLTRRHRAAATARSHSGFGLVELALQALNFLVVREVALRSVLQLAERNACVAQLLRQIGLVRLETLDLLAQRRQLGAAVVRTWGNRATF